jgi:PAS domain S-box-containing protein
MQRLKLVAAIVDSSEDALVGNDTNGVITQWSRGAQKLYGYAADEVIGKPVSLLIPQDHRDDFLEILQRTRRGENIAHYETVRQRKDGRRVNICLSVSPIRDQAGKIIGEAAIARDISQHECYENGLPESENQFRFLADTAPALIWMSGKDKVCTYFNRHWLEFTGRSLEAQLENPWGEGVHPDDLQNCLAIYGQSFDRREKFRREYRLRHSDKQYRWIVETGVPRFDHESLFIGYVGIGVDVTDSKRAEAELSMMNRRLIEAQERERARIARELHDDTSQRLALLALQVEQLKSVPCANEMSVRLEAMRTATLNLARDVQALSHELHSSKLQYLGVIPAMKSFCQEFGTQQKVEIRFKAVNVPVSVSPDISLCLFRVLQEALHNAVKHSGATQFRVLMRGKSNAIHLTVSDSGAGFDPKAALNGHELGLISMKERVHLVKGEMLVRSQPERGTTIHARVPLPSHSASMVA